MTINPTSSAEHVIRIHSVRATPSAASVTQGVRFGEIKWFGGFNSKTGVENPYGFISSLSEDLYFHRSQTSCPTESLVEGAKVVFLPATGRGGKPAATSVRVLSEMPDVDLVALMAETKDLAPEDSLHITAIRGVIAPCENEVLRAVRALSGIAPCPRALEQFWAKFPPTSPSDPFFEWAPMAAKSKMFRQLYAPLLGALQTLFRSVNEVSCSLKADVEYDELTDDDRRLAAHWADGQNDAVLAKMLSARAAEKAARKFYEGVSTVVADISITQLEGGRGNWITHDLLLNSSTPVDVKNARRPINSKQFYVEHTVPRFKLDRAGIEVRVAAVLSPYLNINYIKKPSSIPSKLRSSQNDIVYIGETSRSDIADLTSKFTSERLEVVRRHERTFPHWAFGYPGYWYRELLADIDGATKGCEWPTDEEWAYILDGEALSAIPALCVMGRPLPSAVSAQLEEWQVQFFSTLQASIGSPPSLPAIFFATLTDFLEALRGDRPGFSPQGYRPILYARSQCIHPLGAIDPLGLIDNLIKTLTTLWDHRAKSDLKRFSSFRFGGLGILQGREPDRSEWTTIVAYCGGTVYETDDRGTVLVTPEGQPQSTKGKCGHTPIVIGMNRSCPSCKKLICDKCGFCSVPCREQSFRALADEQVNNPAPPKGRSGSTPSNVGHEMPNWESIPLEAYEDEFRRG